MTLFDLLFLLSFLGALGYGGWILTFAVRGDRQNLRRHAVRLLAGIGLYMTIDLSVGWSSSRPVMPPDGALGYDDWHLAVHRTEWAEKIGDTMPTEGRDRFAIVTLTVTSSARRASQAAPAGALVYLIDADEERYDVSPRGQSAYEKIHGPQPVLTTMLEPSGAFSTVRVFEVPRSVTSLALGHRHGNSGWFPGALIIGEGFCPAPVIQLLPGR